MSRLKLQKDLFLMRQSILIQTFEQYNNLFTSVENKQTQQHFKDYQIEKEKLIYKSLTYIKIQIYVLKFYINKQDFEFSSERSKVMLNKNMKKTQRSYSSFRAKTQQAEIVDDPDSSWIASNNGQKILRNLNHKISTSQLINQKQSNEGLFQSVSQRVLDTKNHYNSCMDANLQNHSEYGTERRSLTNQSQQNIIKSERVIAHLRQKCKNYQKALQFFNRQRQLGQSSDQESVNNSLINNNNNNNKQNIKHANNFNYSEQYYIKEIEELRKCLRLSEQQADKYKGLYTSKSTEICGISTQISQRIEKQTNEKSLYIKQLNMRNIEVKKLTQKLQLFQSQINTKQFVIRQKQQEITQLTGQLENVKQKKLKLQSYENRNNEMEAKLKEIQQYTMTLRTEIQKKDLMYEEKSQQFQGVMNKLQSYESKIKDIENSFVEEIEKNKLYQIKELQLNQHLEKIKQDYISLTPLKQLIKEKDAQLVGLKNSCQQIKARCNQLMIQNQQLTQDLDIKSKSQAKLKEYEHEMYSLKRALRQKQQTIANNIRGIQAYAKLQSQLQTIKKQHQKVKQSSIIKDKTITTQQSQLQSLNQQILSFTQQIQKYQSELQKGKERNLKIDQVYKQNQKLNSMLHQKLNEIQKLQQRITHIENKLCGLTNQNTKLKVIKDELNSQLIKAHNVIDDISQEFERERFLKQKLDEQLIMQGEELNRIGHQCTAYKATINQLEEQNVRINNEMQEYVDENRKHIEFLQQQIQQYAQQRQKCQQMLTKTNQTINVLNNQILDSKANINELMTKESAHKQLMKGLERQLERLEDQKNKLMEEKNKLEKALEKIRSISNQIYGA